MRGFLTFSSAMLLLLISSLPVLAAPGAATSGATYYVDGGHAQAEDRSDHGSIERPWQTIEYALEQLEPGDTLYVRAGVYASGYLELTEAHSGLPEAPITVRAYPGETVLLQNGKMLWFQGASWWVLEGLHFDWPLGTVLRIGAHTAMGDARTALSSHITVRDCEFAHAQYGVLSIHYGQDITIEDNHFHHVRTGVPYAELQREVSAVIVRYIGDNIVIHANQFEEIGSDGVQVGSHAYLEGADIGSITISENEFWVNRPYTGELGNVGENAIDVKRSRGPVWIVGNAIHGFRPTTPDQDASGAFGVGVVLHDGAQNVTLDKNHFYDNTTHLSIKEQASDIVVCNNLFQDAQPNDNPGYLVEGAGLEVRDTDVITLYHNTFYNNYRIMTSDNVSGGVFKNNILVGDEKWIRHQNSTWEADYNSWSQITTTVPDGLQGAHDLWIDDPALGTDLRPLPHSPLIDTGTGVGVLDDFDDNLRADAFPDLGAFEFQLHFQVFLPFVRR